jgi:hypothetical protein
MACSTELFKSELIKGFLWQLFVADRFRRMGYEVETPDLTYAKDVSIYANSQDLRINGHIVEVKSRNLAFSCPEDFPYGSALVDTVSGFEKKTDRPEIYAIVSQHNGAIVCIDVKKTFSLWKSAKRYDSVRKFTDNFYECDRELLEELQVVAEIIIGPAKTSARVGGLI